MRNCEVNGHRLKPELDEQVLFFLRAAPGDHISGNSLSERLSISLSAVARQVQQLRAQGYAIEHHPRLGYRFISSPDVLLPQEIHHGLTSRVMGHRIFSYQRIRSTNETAMEMAQGGALEGSLVVAEEQTEGRGRLSRTWHSPPGLGLWFSVVLRPQMSPDRAPQLAICGALAIAEVVYASTHLPVKVKWPNDVLARGKKLAGVLTEARLDQERVRFVVLGMGVNVNQADNDFPSELRGRATSIRRELGRPYSRVRLLQDILSHFEGLYDQFQTDGLSAFLQRWRQLSWVLGHRVRVEVGGTVFSGLAVDIEATGALVVEEESGKRRRFLAGDISLR